MPDVERLGFAILGPGLIADRYQQAIAANADLGAHLVAVGHYNPERFAEIGARFGVPCLSLDDLLGRADVDVICITTPSGQHAAQAIAAARAGKHVLVEKPIALSLADADAMIAACHAAGVQLGVCLQRRTEPIYQQMRRAVVAGDLGDLTLGLAIMPFLRPPAYFEQATWRGTWALDGGGVLMNQGHPPGRPADLADGRPGRGARPGRHAPAGDRGGGHAGRHAALRQWRPGNHHRHHNRRPWLSAPDRAVRHRRRYPNRGRHRPGLDAGRPDPSEGRAAADRRADPAPHRFRPSRRRRRRSRRGGARPDRRDSHRPSTADRRTRGARFWLRCWRSTRRPGCNQA